MYASVSKLMNIRPMQSESELCESVAALKATFKAEISHQTKDSLRVTLPFRDLKDGLPVDSKLLVDINCRDTHFLLDLLNFSEVTDKEVKLETSKAIGIIRSIRLLYEKIEADKHPNKEFIIRDFAYPISDPRFWGRQFIEVQETKPTKARVLYTFKAESDNEISVVENEVVMVCGDVGNGLLLVKRLFTEEKGFVPENYIDYILEDE